MPHISDGGRLINIHSVAGQRAKIATERGLDEKVVTACLLHDIAVVGLLSSDHDYRGAQMVAPYVGEEVAWAVEKHEALRYFADEAAGYSYPEAYVAYFGADYDPPECIHQEHAAACKHRWYMTSSLITINEVYSFDPAAQVDFDEFEDVVGRNFRQPKEGARFRRITGRPHVAHDDLAEQLPVTSTRRFDHSGSTPPRRRRVWTVSRR